MTKANQQWTGILVLGALLIGSPVLAIDVEANDEPPVVEELEFVESGSTAPPAEPAPEIEEPVLEETTDPEVPAEEIVLEETEDLTEKPETITIHADIDTGDETSTSTIVELIDEFIIETIDTQESHVLSTSSTEDGTETLDESDESTDDTPDSASSTVQIFLQIETYEGTLYNDTFVVSECKADEAGTTTTINIWCAIQQLGEQEGWNVSASWSALGITYDINHYTGEYIDDFTWWGWHVDDVPGGTAVNAYPLTDDEHILLVYGLEPARLSISSSSPAFGETVALSYLSYDWNTYSWMPTPSSTFVVNDVEYIEADGIYELAIISSSTYSVLAYKTGYLASDTYTLTPVLSPTTTPDDDTPDTGDDIGSGGGGGGGDDAGTQTLDFSPTDADIQNAANKILSYVKDQQEADGSILDGGTTDWLLMSFAAAGENPYDIATASSSLMDFALGYDFNGFTDLNPCAGYPRHILALRAGGIESTDPAITTLQDHITSDACYNSDTAYGSAEGTGINDDIFALLALLSSGFDSTADIVTDLTTDILANQSEAGGFGWSTSPSADMTGAVLSALVYAQEVGDVSIDASVLDEAKAYLKNEQLADGGWNGWGAEADVFTTTWALMGINALGESQTDWLTDTGYTPWNPLVEQVQDDGYYESEWAPGPDWFSTKHAVPALLGATWPVIGAYTAPAEENSDDTGPIITTSNRTDNATSTTTTTNIVTSTLDIVDTPTSTEDVLESPTSTDANLPTSTEATLDETGQEVLPLAIGGGIDESEDFSQIERVAGIKIASPVTITEEPTPASQESPPTEQKSEDMTRGDDTSTTESVQQLPFPFAISLGITILLVIALCWRFVRTLV